MGAVSLMLAFIAVYAYIINGGFIHIATDRQMVKDKLVARSSNLAKTLRVREALVVGGGPGVTPAAQEALMLAWKGKKAPVS